jgi:hypothetical protein
MSRLSLVLRFCQIGTVEIWHNKII